MKKEKILLLIGSALFITVSTLYLVEKTRFPVTLVVCDRTYSDCFASEKFRNRMDCELASKRGSWLCDEGDPDNIKCNVSKNPDAAAYCK